MLTRFDLIRRGSAFLYGLLLVALLLPMVALAAQPTEPAGYVLTASGSVVALQANKQLRPLKRKSPFFPGESLRTGSDGKAQVRFRDGSLISLRADTEIRLDEFRFNEPQKGGDKNIFTLISGGFRTITGKIGKGDPDAYQMKSSVASIGVRGTTYEAVLSGGLDVAAWQGTIIVANGRGSIAVGAEGLYNFASVQSNNQAPRGLMKPPSSIRESQEVKPDEMTTERESGAAEDEPEAQPLGGGDEGEGGEFVAATREGSAAVMESVTAEKEVVTVYETVVNPPPPPPPPVAGDYRISGVTLDRLAMAVAAGDANVGMLAGGKAGYDSSGVLRIADNGLDPSQPGFDTAAFLKVLSQGLAVAGTPAKKVIDASHSVEWGEWQVTAAAPAYLLTDPNDASIYTVVTQPVYWISGNASATTVMAARQGLVEYSNVLGFAGASNSGAIEQMYMNLSVNFDTAAAIGEVHIYAPGQYWEVNLSGNVAGPTLDFTSVSGTLNGSGTVYGDFSSLFTGATAQALASSFDLSVNGVPSSYVAGVALVDNMGVDLRAATVDLTTLDRFGFVTKFNDVAGAGIKMGLASDGYIGDPVFALNKTLPGDPFFNSSINFDVLLGNGAVLPLGFMNHGIYPVSWGVWDVGAMLLTSGFDPSLANEVVLNDQLFWMTVLPTNDMGLASRSGKASYQYNGCCSADMTLVDNGGGVNSTSFDLVVDFDKATFLGRLYLYETDMDSWSLQFKGNIQGPNLAITAPLVNTNYWNSGSATSYGINGGVNMTFTGGNAEAVAVLYDLEAATAPNFHVQGAFVAEQDLRLTMTEMADMKHLAVTAGGPLGSWWKMSTSADGVASPVFAGDTMYDPNFDVFYLTTNSMVWRAGFAIETHLGSHQVMSNPAYTVNWGVWDATTGGNEILGYPDAANPASSSYYNGMTHWLVFTPTPPAALAAKTGSLNYTVPVAIAANGIDGPVDTASFTFGATVNFDTGALSNGQINLSHLTGQSWSMAFSAPAGSLGKAGAFPYMGATGTYTNGATVGATGNVGIMTTGPNAEALAGALYFWDSGGGGSKNVEGVFLICKSSGC